MIKMVYIIYNPNSTGNGQANAKQFAAELQNASSDINVKLRATEYAGHSTELAQQYAGPDTMIVSSSGDGGFNEVINGILASQHPDTVVGLLPSGNANDHYNFHHNQAVIPRILASKITVTDVIKAEWNQTSRYAHSYVGIGMTAAIGEILTKHKLNPIKELWLVTTHLFAYAPVRISVDGRTEAYDSIVFSVIGRMSKYFMIGDGERANDGTFDITRLRSRSLIDTLRWIIRHLFQPVKPIKQADNFSFVARHNLKMQLDGETVDIPAETKVTITCQPEVLHCII